MPYSPQFGTTQDSMPAMTNINLSQVVIALTYVGCIYFLSSEQKVTV